MLFPGDWVEVRSADEILATLDANQALEALPFMPEMLPFCGRIFQVQIWADRTCVRALPPGAVEPIRALKNCVVLEGLRCDGASHGGCQLGCMFFWKERWLKQVGGSGSGEQPSPRLTGAHLLACRENEPATYFCQGTELGQATGIAPSRWNPLEYLLLLRRGTFSFLELVRMLHVAGSRKILNLFRSPRPVWSDGPSQWEEDLELQPGDWVEVKHMKEIVRTLDLNQCNKGLAFSNDMFSFCGKRFRVASRIQTILSERTGKVRTLTNTVALTGTHCRKYLGCARQMPLLWREAWLKRVTDGCAPVPPTFL